MFRWYIQKMPHIFYSSQCLWTKRNKGRIKKGGKTPTNSEQMMEQAHHLDPWLHRHKLPKGHEMCACGCVVVYVFPKYDWKTRTQKHLLAAHQPKFIQQSNISQLFQRKMSGRNLFFWLHYTNVHNKNSMRTENKLFSRSGPWIWSNFGVSGWTTTKTHEPPQKTPTFHYTGWLHNREPHNGLLQSPHHWVLFHTMSSSISTQTTRGPFFIADMASSAANSKGVGSFRRC